MHKIDTDGDWHYFPRELHRVSNQDIRQMDTSTAHRGMVGPRKCLQRAAPTAADGGVATGDDDRSMT